MEAWHGINHQGKGPTPNGVNLQPPCLSATPRRLHRYDDALLPVLAPSQASTLDVDVVEFNTAFGKERNKKNGGGGFQPPDGLMVHWWVFFPGFLKGFRFGSQVTWRSIPLSKFFNPHLVAMNKPLLLG